MAQETLSFEEAFKRLEQILNAMNGGKTSLEESLKLFEEASKLIDTCSKRLNSAEQKIEQLMKQKGEILLDINQQPMTEVFRTHLS
jgi:exodeoxyribonuclease VII small subunit